MIQGVIPTYNCIKADGKVTIDGKPSRQVIADTLIALLKHKATKKTKKKIMKNRVHTCWLPDLRELAETIRNMTQFLRPSTTSTAAPPPEQTDLPPPEEEPVDDNEAGEGVGDEPTAPTEPARAPFFAKFPNVFRF